MIVLDGGQLMADLGQQRAIEAIDDDHLVLGVVDHVGQLLGEQPDVEGVQHRAHAGHGQVGLEVMLVVPSKRSDPIAGTDPELLSAAAS